MNIGMGDGRGRKEGRRERRRGKEERRRVLEGKEGEKMGRMRTEDGRGEYSIRYII